MSRRNARYDNGVVTLMGYSYRGSLKADAERAVKRIPEVTSVVNKIEDLSPSSMDEGCGGTSTSGSMKIRSWRATPLAAACCGAIVIKE